MKKKQNAVMGLLIPKKLRIGGITFYQRGGQVIGRESTSMEKRSNTLAQFKQRQKMRHTTALWKMLRFCETMFTQRQTAYQNFASLANQLPVVYVTKNWMTDASFLMPGIPVSDGTLPTVKQELGEVDGVAALKTDLMCGEPHAHEKLWLYTAVQNVESDLPRVRFSRREVSWYEMTVVDGRFVLKGDEFAAPMKGWALVLIKGDRCSPQTIVTRCTIYQQYMTEEALQVAAKSYGGITETPFLSPR